MQTSSIACNGVNPVMIVVVEFIENHPPPDDE
jgi:hypothetical protein